MQKLITARIDALHQGLTQLVLDGGDLDQIAARVAEALDVGILVTSTDGRERAAAATAWHRTLLDEADLVDPTGRIRVERAKGSLALADGEVRSTAIAAGGTDLARLVSIRPAGVLDAADLQALERAATVAALLITREQAVQAVENKYRGDFLRDIFLGRAGPVEFVLEHAETFGWVLARPMVVLAAEIDPDETPVSSRVSRAWQERFSAAWSQVCRGRDPGIPSADFSSEVVTLLPAPLDADGEPDVPALRAAVSETVSAVAGDRGGGRRPFSVGISRVVTDLADLPAAYNQAGRAVRVGRRMNGGRSTTWFDDLGLHRLIALVTDEEELRAFAHDVLGELASDTEEAADLRATLQHLLDTNVNVAEAARLQFFHYNTMRYRVGKLERILGPFTSNPHLRLNVAVALQVLEVTG
ncbi:helix-turn-helix domain-containing protein [Nocardioides sp. JQ2195]|uniref:PucR family transcriptional regulator n=1 Tax=Nocardioides sp. JQ2195 TaxID=2592334 RepID=UPI00197D0C39|nr:helix-turn-helix domain-containing protein [Nocardioides sp. JQ2195]